jgi:RNA polymerase sigma-70 factor (ECF subfamily)
MSARSQLAHCTADPGPVPADAEVRSGAPAASMDVEFVVRRYSGYVATIALRLLGREDDVDDVVQEVFLSAIRGLAGLRDEGALRGWLATVTVRKVRRRLRWRRWTGLIGLDDKPDYREILVAPGGTPEELATLARVYELLDALPVEQRVAWALRTIHGDGLEAVAEACGCSLATAKRRIQAAQRAIERLMGDG